MKSESTIKRELGRLKKSLAEGPERNGQRLDDYLRGCVKALWWATLPSQRGRYQKVMAWAKKRDAEAIKAAE